jgi:hypothetical protein
VHRKRIAPAWPHRIDGGYDWPAGCNARWNMEDPMKNTTSDRHRLEDLLAIANLSHEELRCLAEDLGLGGDPYLSGASLG